ncbi:MFS transporter [Lichenicoccus roseus]|uniref:MFS transporter n=1 Tax=Lichenicoccus roseus TaxID=2683649 RepID=A0A5R9JFP8_9PROT|nr:MFS transporter [Lichenicoccus roseus]TLU74236.1 MFS transporter [Lichenicoccus roseus]
MSHANLDTDATPPVRLLSHPGLSLLLLSRGGSSLGYQMQAVAVGWQIYELTHRAFSLGLLGLAQFAPMVLLIFVAGHVADQFDRRRVAALCQCVEALGATVLAAGSLLHFLTPGLIYAVVALLGAARAFEGPCMQAMLPSLVPAALFPRAAALSSSMLQTCTIVGPSLGGLLYGLGAPVPYVVCTAMFLVAACMNGLVRMESPPRPARKVDLDAVFGGIRFIRANPDILGAISLDLFAVLLGGATALLPVYAHDILHAGPVALGLLRAAPAIGALAVSLVLARRPISGGAGRLMFAAVAVFGIATIVFGVSRSLPLSIGCLAVLGGADVVSVVVRSSLVQLRTPEEMRGRVSAVNMLFIGTSNQLGEFESGSLAALVGAVPAVVLGGVGTLLVTLLWMKLFPTLRRLDRLEAS